MGKTRYLFKKTGVIKGTFLARRDNKAFLSDQCREIEENKRMGKSRDLFKKIRGAKGTFLAKMGQ